MRAAAVAGTFVTLALLAGATRVAAQESRANRPPPPSVGAPTSHVAPAAKLVPDLPSLGFVESDSAQRNKPWLPGFRGALIGAVVGAAAGAVLVQGLCDVPNCSSHPDTHRIMLGGIYIGAVLGFIVELGITSNRKAMSVRLRLGGG